MEPVAIRNMWRPRRNNAEANVAMWNAMADDFNDRELPTFEDNRLLGIFERHAMLSPDSEVLDVACGAGSYSLAIAGRVRTVVGVDISPDMIAHARAKAADLGVGNVRFLTGDWREFDLSAEGMEDSFDLVFAHMTPAIDAPDVFEKLMHASRNWCVISKPTRRRDPISDAIRTLLGIAENRESGDADIAYGFCLLWAEGLLPHMEYEQTVWDRKRPVEQARQIYINRMRTYRDLTDADVAQVERYLQSIADADGLVGEKTDVTIATMFWQV